MFAMSPDHFIQKKIMLQPQNFLTEFNNIQEHDVHLQNRLNINILLYI